MLLIQHSELEWWLDLISSIKLKGFLFSTNLIIHNIYLYCIMCTIILIHTKDYVTMHELQNL